MGYGGPSSSGALFLGSHVYFVYLRRRLFNVYRPCLQLIPLAPRRGALYISVVYNWLFKEI